MRAIDRKKGRKERRRRERAIARAYDCNWMCVSVCNASTCLWESRYRAIGHCQWSQGDRSNLNELDISWMSRDAYTFSARNISNCDLSAVTYSQFINFHHRLLAEAKVIFMNECQKKDFLNGKWTYRPFTVYQTNRYLTLKNCMSLWDQNSFQEKVPIPTPIHIRFLIAGWLAYVHISFSLLLFHLHRSQMQFCLQNNYTPFRRALIFKSTLPNCFNDY